MVGTTLTETFAQAICKAFNSLYADPEKMKIALDEVKDILNYEDD